MAWYGSDGWDYYPPYLSVGEKKARGALALATLLKKTRRTAEPVVAPRGRRFTATFWGQAWADNLERYADLANRLSRLVEHGILERRCCTDDRRKVQYRLTPKGEALLPTLIALRQWGERWGNGGLANPVLVDTRDGKPVAEIMVRAADGRPLRPDELRWVDRAELSSGPLVAPAKAGTGGSLRG